MSERRSRSAVDNIVPGPSSHAQDTSALDRSYFCIQLHGVGNVSVEWVRCTLEKRRTLRIFSY